MAHTHASSKKRRREPVTIDTKLVEIYEDLANEKDEIRLKAAQALVSQFTPDKKPTDEQMRKALQRLFRGLCSSRKAARIGFSIALTEILAQIFAAQREESEITIPAVVGIWEAQSNASGSETGQVKLGLNSACLKTALLTVVSGTKRSPLWPAVWSGSSCQVVYSVQGRGAPGRLDQAFGFGV